MPVLNVYIFIGLTSVSSSVNACSLRYPLILQENQPFYWTFGPWQINGSGCGGGGGGASVGIIGTYLSGSLGIGFPPIANDGTLATITGTYSGSSAINGNSSSFGLTGPFSINKAGYYTTGPIFSPGGPSIFAITVLSGASGSTPTSTTSSILVTYQSASAMYIKDFYNDIAINNKVIANGTYQNLITGSIVPVTPANIPVSYGAVSTSTGSLVGTFSGSIFGRINGYAIGGPSQSYAATFYANPFSGSFYGIVTGSICGDISGYGNMAGFLEAGPIAVVSASINGGANAAYSGSITGSISGSISGSIACGIANEIEQLLPEEFVKLTDGRLRLYYSKGNAVQNTIAVSNIETAPVGSE